ncbi:type IX secretion system outer membrane channel protein PorV [Ignavibacteria bacterium]|nr:PorV/PorQ family protein [Bacteroidota bacterium]
MKTHIKRIIWSAAAFLCCSSVPAFSQAGGSAVPFLLISADARACGMGETGTAIADNLNAIYWNSGGLGFQDSRQVALNFSRWLPQFNADLYYSSGSYGQFSQALDGMIAVNFILMNLGEFTRTNEAGNKLGTFRSQEFALSIGYGTMLADDIGAGVVLRYIQSNLAPITGASGGAGTGRSGSFDFGALWKPQKLNILGLDLSDKFSLGANLQNVGPKVTYLQEADPLPTSLRLGMAVNVARDEFNDLTFTVDAAKLLVRRDGTVSDPIPKSLITAWEKGGMETSLGAEYWYDRIIALRAGYFTEPASAGNRNFVTFGAGVRYDMFNLDFSFLNTIEDNHPLANTMRFSLIVDWANAGK